MPEPTLRFTRLARGERAARLLVVGPSLGTSVEALWGAAAALSSADVEVVGWNLPGHGRSEPTTTAFTVPDLAAAVRRGAAGLADACEALYAGVSLGGAVALELAIDPGVFTHVSCFAGAARIGEPEMWHERAALVRRAGTQVMVATSAQRWFAPGFPDRDPATANRLLLSLSDADAGSYASACEALAEFDLRSRLAELRTPLLIAPGELDTVVPASLAEQTAVAAPGAVLKVVPGCGHLPPAEAPGAVAALLDVVAEEAAHG